MSPFAVALCGWVVVVVAGRFLLVVVVVVILFCDRIAAARTAVARVVATVGVLLVVAGRFITRLVVVVVVGVSVALRFLDSIVLCIVCCVVK